MYVHSHLNRFICPHVRGSSATHNSPGNRPSHHFKHHENPYHDKNDNHAKMSRDHNYPQEDPDQRLMLCQLLQLLRQVVANVYAVTLFFNFFFRVILIRFSDRGLVVDGKPELALFNQVIQCWSQDILNSLSTQLYWIIFAAFFAMGFLTYPVAKIMRGTFPESILGSVCLLRGVENKLYMINRKIDNIQYIGGWKRRRTTTTWGTGLPCSLTSASRSSRTSTSLGRCGIISAFSLKVWKQFPGSLPALWFLSRKKNVQLRKLSSQSSPLPWKFEVTGHNMKIHCNDRTGI